jgi:hypothetical protein
MCPPRPLAATAERTLKALESPPGVAEDEARTRDIDLGRIALHQLRYPHSLDAFLERRPLYGRRPNHFLTLEADRALEAICPGRRCVPIHKVLGARLINRRAAF